MARPMLTYLRGLLGLPSPMMEAGFPEPPRPQTFRPRDVTLRCIGQGERKKRIGFKGKRRRR